jgi:hypothetical protein
MKLQVKSLLGNVLFEYDPETSSLKESLISAVKSGANLYGADLRGADLYGANLYGADLRGADLREANLYGANLREANLREANLREANLYGADLRGADLYGANLYGADLRGAKNADYAIAQTRILPEGDIIGYKKCRNNIIVKLLIPKEAKRSSAFGRKCRAEYAQVLEIFSGAEKAVSQEDSNFIYKVGETVRPTKPFNEDWTNECSTGIHFFITKIEAENY